MTNSTTNKVSSQEITVEHIREFFDDFISKIERDKQEMLIGTASEEKSKMYDGFIRKDLKTIEEEYIRNIQYKNLQEMLNKYLDKLLSNDKKPEKLAFSFGNNLISVFAVIGDDDTELANHLILSEACVIPEYFSKGYKMTTMIVEKSESYTIPQEFKEFPIQ